MFVLFKLWRPLNWSFPACVCVRVVLKAATMQCDDWITAGAVGGGKTWAAQRYDMWFVIHKMTTASYICTVYIYIYLWYRICHAQFRFVSFRFCVHNEKTFPSMGQVTLGLLSLLKFRCWRRAEDADRYVTGALGAKTWPFFIDFLGRPWPKCWALVPHLCWAGDLHWSQWQAGDVADCTAKDAGQAKPPSCQPRFWDIGRINMFQYVSMATEKTSGRKI